MIFRNCITQFSLYKFLIILSAFILVLMSSTEEIIAQENLMYVGFSFPLDNNVNINFSKIRPWVQASITEFSPNQVNGFKLNEAHHLYLGAILYGVGHVTKSRMLKAVGGVLVIDDALQHTLKIDTPVHNISNALGKHQWYRSLTTSADSFFGKSK